MLRGVLVSAALLPVLGGCVFQVQLANNKGQMAECSAAGLGIVSSLVAASVQHNCIDQYQKQGFHQVPAPAPSATATTSTDTPSDAVKTSAATRSAAAKTPAKSKGPDAMQFLWHRHRRVADGGFDAANLPAAGHCSRDIRRGARAVERSDDTEIDRSASVGEYLKCCGVLLYRRPCCRC
jgi:hypothetical protein